MSPRKPHRRGRKPAPTKIRRQPGAPPGTLYTQATGERSTIRVMRYSVDRLEEFECDDPGTIPDPQDGSMVTWVDVAGLADEKLLRSVAERFGFHPLALEDVAHVDQRAKLEPYPPFVFLIARAAVATDHLGTEQISLFVRDGLVVSFQEHSEDTFGAVRERVRVGRPRLRAGGAPYLAYALLDFVVDSYFPVVEGLRERLDVLEDEVMSDPGEGVLHGLQQVRGELLTLRRAIWPHREMLSQVMRTDEPFGGDTAVFLRDVYDHVVQIIDLIESYRDSASDLMGVYLSQVSNRMNEVMKVLTMIATVFIPLSFIVGLYGMNFDTASPYNMPELGWRYGYPTVVGIMAVMALGLVVYFARKGWFR